MRMQIISSFQCSAHLSNFYNTLLDIWRPCCHPERSEGSDSPEEKILSAAKNDRQDASCWQIVYNSGILLKAIIPDFTGVDEERRARRLEKAAQ
jgi:hypothetical protein